MRSFIIENAIYIVAACAGIELLMGIFVLAFRGRRKTYGVMRACMFMLCMGLFYDAAVILLGRFIGDGNPLWILSVIRYLLAAVLIPLIFPICSHAGDLDKKGKLVMRLLMLFFMVLGLFHTIMTEIRPVEFAGLLRYTVSDATPKWAVILSGASTALCMIPLFVFGVRIMLSKRNIALLLAGISGLGCSILAPATGNSDLMVFFSMIGEALMVFFMFLHAQTARDPDFT